MFTTIPPAVGPNVFEIPVTLGAPPGPLVQTEVRVMLESRAGASPEARSARATMEVGMRPLADRFIKVLIAKPLWSNGGNRVGIRRESEMDTPSPPEIRRRTYPNPAQPPCQMDYLVTWRYRFYEVVGA